MKFGFHLLYNIREGIYYIKIQFLCTNSKENNYIFGHWDNWAIVCFKSYGQCELSN